MLVAEAVHALDERRVSATVNAIAHEIGIDQSGASRLTKSAAAAGYVTLSVVSTDSRRREATLTPAGRSMLEQAHRWQEEIFEQLTAGWSDKRRRDFQQAMIELMDRSYALDA